MRLSVQDNLLPGFDVLQRPDVRFARIGGLLLGCQLLNGGNSELGTAGTDGDEASIDASDLFGSDDNSIGHAIQLSIM